MNGTRSREQLVDVAIAEFRGDNDTLSAQEIDAYTVIDDGEHKWLASTDDYRRGVVAIVSRVRAGEYDNTEDDVDFRACTYNDLCETVPYIYCSTNHRSLDRLAALEIDADTRHVINVAIGVR